MRKVKWRLRSVGETRRAMQVAQSILALSDDWQFLVGVIRARHHQAAYSCIGEGHERWGRGREIATRLVEWGDGPVESLCGLCFPLARVYVRVATL